MPTAWRQGHARPGAVSSESVVMRDRPAPPAGLASDRVIALCPECGDRMRLSTPAPKHGTVGNTIHFDCACGYSLQQPVVPL